MNQNNDVDLPVDVEDIYPLTYLQQGILFHTLATAESGIYCPRYAYTVEGLLDIDHLEWAWQQVVARHAVLRSAIIWDEADEPLQVVLRHADLRVAIEDWTALTPAEQQRALDAFLEQEGLRGHDLTTAPLLRIKVFRLAPALSKVAMSFHHLVLDGWSVGIVLKEVFTLYHARAEGRSIELPPAPSFREFVKFARRQDPDAENFFRSELAGLTRATQLAEAIGGGTAEQGRASCTLPLGAGITRRIERSARERQITVSSVLEAGYALLLARQTGTSDVLFGTTVSGRSSGADGIDRLVGLCINTLPTRIRIDDSASVDDWMRRLHARFVAMRGFEQTALTAIRGLSEIPSDEPLFESILVIENYPIDRTLARRIGDFQVTAVAGVEETSYPLTMIVMVSDSILLELKYDKALFSAATASSLLERYRTLLDALSNGEKKRVGELSVMSAAERHKVLVGWNPTASVYDRSRLIHELLDEQAAKTPERVVLEHGSSTLTYDELRRRSNQLAHYLRGKGVGPEQPVAICVERSERLLVAIFGVLKAGGAYLPLDPQYPEERTRFMLEQSGARVLLTESRLLRGLPDTLAERLLLDVDADKFSAESGEAPHVPLLPENLAYVIYTSGSTGQPKGVAIEHRNTVAFIAWCRQHLTEQDLRGVLASTSVCFDVSVFELIAAPCLGARLILVENVLELTDLANSHAVTLVSTVPAAMTVLAQGSLPPSLRVINLAGEPVEATLVRALYAHPQVEQVWNLYGPTEDTTYSTVALMDPADARPPIGRPIANRRAYLLGHDMTPVAPGVVAEIYLGGAGLSRGYLGRPELSAERYLPSPFGPPGERLYKTGDRGRYRADGTLECLGRSDGQIKIRGYRVELSEIETALRACLGVESGLVVAREGASGDKVLNAYFTAQSGSSLTSDTLRDLLRARLPKYMVPEVFVQLDALPRLPNGKPDRTALRAMPVALADGSYVAPRTPIEERLSSIIQDVLGAARLGIHDDFFAAGMHSLSATRAAGRVRQAFALDLPLRALFEAPTVEALARHIEARLAEPVSTSHVPAADEGLGASHAQERLWLLKAPQTEVERRLQGIWGEVLRGAGFRADADFFPLGEHSELATLLIERVRQTFGLELPLRSLLEHRALAGLAVSISELAALDAFSSAIPVQGRDLPLPLSFAQQRLWLLGQLNPGAATYNTPIAARVRGPLDVTALERALGDLVKRHEVLRAAFGSSDGQPMVDLRRANLPRMVKVDLGALEQSAREAAIERLAAEDALAPFDLARGPLLRVTLLCCTPDYHALLFTMHHIVCDGWSFSVLSDELAALYEGHRCGKPAELSPLPIQYADFAAWQRGYLVGEVLQQKLDYWLAQLDGAPTSIELPTDHERPPSGQSVGSTFSFPLSGALSRAVHTFSVREHVTPFMTLLSAFQTLLHRYSGQTDLVVGTPIANRNHLETEGLIGFFVNTLPLRVNLSHSPSFVELVARTREAALGAYANQDLPFERLVEALNPDRGGGVSPIFQVMFVLQNVPSREFSVPNLTLEPLVMDTRTSKFDLTLLLGQTDDALLATFEYNADLFESATIERMARHFEALLEGALAHPEQAIDRIPLLGRGQEALPQPFMRRANHGAAGLVALAANEIELGREPPMSVPRDELELGILRIWEELLHRTGIRITDNFFDLGGHSLLAARMMIVAQDRLGISAPLAALFAAPTVAGLASRLRKLAGAAEISPLLEIHPHGSCRPLFCVHPAGGSSAGYVELSRALGPEQPLYGLDALGLRGDAAISTSIQEMAALYVRAIRSVQPRGPYQLSGWSLGGVIAFEMACQLRRLGEAVAPVVLFDSRAPTTSNRGAIRIPSDPASALAELSGHSLSDLIATPLDEWHALSEAESFREIALLLQARDLLPPDAPLSALEKIGLVYRQQLQAFAAYAPERSTEQLVLFRPRQGMPDGDGESDRTLGWQEFTTEEVQVLVVPGAHESMVRAPHVLTLAEELRQLLRARAAA